MTTRTPLIQQYQPTPEQTAAAHVTAQAAAEYGLALTALDAPQIVATFARYRDLYGQALALYQEGVKAGARDSVHPSTALVMWIKAAPDQQKRHYRQAVAYMVTGNLYSPKG